MDGEYATEIAEASRMFAEAILSGETNLRRRATTLDSEAKDLMRRVGLATMSKVLAALSAEVAREATSAGLKVNRQRSVRFSVVFGQLEVASPYFWDAATKRSARPVRDELGLRDRGRSLGVERALSDFGIEESFSQASKRFVEHYGWEVGRTTILRLVEDRAREAEAFVNKRLQQAEQDYLQPLASRSGADRLLVEMDGCEIRTGQLAPARTRQRTAVRKAPRRKRVEAWREVRVGFAGPIDAPDERTYVARMDDYDSAIRQLFAGACDQGLSSQTRMVAVADGGNGLREGLDAQFPGLLFILDRPHLKQHFYEAADAQGLTGEEREVWVSGHLHTIDAGGARKVLCDLGRHKGRGKKRVKRLVKYLTRFVDAVHYDRFRKEGLPLGSGEIESCHRWLPQKRLKLPGAWWHPDTINPMLAFRVLRANGWWEDFWHMQRTALERDSGPGGQQGERARAPQRLAGAVARGDQGRSRPQPARARKPPPGARSGTASEPRPSQNLVDQVAA